MYTDHRNLLFVFAPLALEPALGRHIVSKVQRWALFLSRFPYVIEHVDGTSNIFADILTRWTRGYRKENKSLKTLCSLLDSSAQIIPAADEFIWPDLDAIRRSQQRHGERSKGLLLNPLNNLWEMDGRIWIPESDLNLQLKILVASHCGSIGHRGQDGTRSILKENFFWNGMAKDVEQLVKGCLHCLITRSGDIIPRPLAHAQHGERPNEVVHLDFLYMGRGAGNNSYILIVRDDHSSYIWLFPCEAATSEEAANALTTWISSFGGMEWFVTDQGSHFKNCLVKQLTSEFRIHHHFTTAYSSWANGTVERICREVLRSCKALCSEWKLTPQDWPCVTECVQSILNHARLKRLGLRDKTKPGVYRTPLEVFTGHLPSRPLLRALPITKYRHAQSQDVVKLRRLVNIDSMQSALEDMHRDIKYRVELSRKRQVSAHNRKTKLQPINFQVGDFVLVRRAAKKGHKLKFLWIGPRRVTAVKSDLVFEVEDLLHAKREVVHARRLQLYRADMDKKPVEERLLRAAQHTEAVYQDALALRAIRSTDGAIDIQVEWEGLPDNIDLTWEPLQQVQEDLPELLETYLQTSGSRKLKETALAQCVFK